jgi:SAM-dependent methyltransferase
MSASWKLLYRLGLTPWEHEHVEQPLRDLVEGPAALPPGRALDLGCGTGRDAVYLAQHGWQVTGVDFVPQALARAVRRGAEAGVEVRWVQGDISAPDTLDLGPDHTLLVDLGCFHGLGPAQRQRAAEAITKAAASGATLLVFAFSPGRRGPAPRGLDEAELRSRFPGWDLAAAWPATDVELPGPMRNAEPHWYRLVKRA